ncbi:MAG: G1 family glutamic endopeptidase [Thermoguttaceae bacterium]
MWPRLFHSEPSPQPRRSKRNGCRRLLRLERLEYRTLLSATTVTAIVTVANKAYDGTTAATIIGEALSGVPAGDVVSLTGGKATFATAAVGTGITVTVTGLSLTGPNAANCVLASTTVTTTANITSGAQKKSTLSTNWAGYAAATDLNQPLSGSVSAVSGSWHVPAVTGTGTAYSAVWVGIDGYTSSTVEQIGTESDLVNGQPRYSVWYETYPQSSVNITTMTVSPRDSISASVQYVASGAYAGQFKLTITDTSRANDSFTTYQIAPQAQRSSAEWIVEAPSSNSSVLPLANFASVTFTNATATIKGVTGPIDSSNWQESAINIANSALTETSTSGLTDANGASAFTVAYLNSGSMNSDRSQIRGTNWPLARALCFAEWP